jgi:hypothetical protein
VSKSIICDFKPPLAWKTAAALDLAEIGSIIYKTSGGSMHIESLRCDAKDFERVASVLRNKKIAFQQR